MLQQKLWMLEQRTGKMHRTGGTGGTGVRPYELQRVQPVQMRLKVTLAYLQHAALIDGEVILRLLCGGAPSTADGAVLRHLGTALPAAYASCLHALCDRVDAARRAVREAHAALEGPAKFGQLVCARDRAHEYHQSTIYLGRSSVPVLVPQADREDVGTQRSSLHASHNRGLRGCSRSDAGTLPSTLHTGRTADRASARLDITACGMPLDSLASVPVLTQPISLLTLVDTTLAACGARAGDDARTSAALRQALALLVGLEASGTAFDILRPSGMDVAGASDIDRVYGTPPGAAAAYEINRDMHAPTCSAAATGACSCDALVSTVHLVRDHFLTPLGRAVSVDGMARAPKTGTVGVQRGRVVFVPAHEHEASTPIVDASPPSSDEEGADKVRDGKTRTAYSLCMPLGMPRVDRKARKASTLQATEADLWSMLDWDETQAGSVAVHLPLTAVHLGIDPAVAGVDTKVQKVQEDYRQTVALAADGRLPTVTPPLSPSELPVLPCDVFLLTCLPMADQLSAVMHGAEADGRDAPLQGAFGLRPSGQALLGSSWREVWREDAVAVAAVARNLGEAHACGPALLRRLLRLTALSIAVATQLEAEAEALRAAFRLDGSSLRPSVDGALATLAAEVDAEDPGSGGRYSTLAARGQDTCCKLATLLGELRKAAGVTSQVPEVRAMVVRSLDGRGRTFPPRRPQQLLHLPTVLSLGGDDFQQPGPVRPAEALGTADSTLKAISAMWALPRRAILVSGADMHRAVHGASCLLATRLFALARVTALYEWLRGAVALPASEAVRVRCSALLSALRTHFTDVDETVLKPHRAAAALTSLDHLRTLAGDSKSRAELQTEDRLASIVSRLEGVAAAVAAGALFRSYLDLQTLDSDAYTLSPAPGGGPAGGSPPSTRPSAIAEDEEGPVTGNGPVLNPMDLFEEVEGASHADFTPDRTPPRDSSPPLPSADPFDIANFLAAGSPPLPRQARLIADHGLHGTVQTHVRFGASASELEGSDDRSAPDEDGSVDGGGDAPAAAPLPPPSLLRAPISPWVVSLYNTRAWKKGSSSPTPSTTGSRSPPAPTTSHVGDGGGPPLRNSECGQCGMGGTLLMCESARDCPRASHAACVGFKSLAVPWLCPQCVQEEEEQRLAEDD